jgi:hypothetical protein
MITEIHVTDNYVMLTELHDRKRIYWVMLISIISNIQHHITVY